MNETTYRLCVDCCYCEHTRVVMGPDRFECACPEMVPEPTVDLVSGEVMPQPVMDCYRLRAYHGTSTTEGEHVCGHRGNFFQASKRKE